MRNRFSVAVLLVASFLILASGLATAASFSPAVQNGLAWLSGQVQPDGSLTAEPAAMGSALQCRVESEYTLALLAAPSAPLTNAITADARDDTESLARRIFALSASGGDVGALVGVLTQRQNADGGFSARMFSDADSIGFSNLLDSAWGLIALTAANAGGDAAALAARDYLMAAIDAGGGMAGFSDGDGVQAAALSLIALSGTPPSAVLTTTLNGMATWLASRQTADGSWLGDAYLTGIALYAIAPQAVDGAVRDKARNFLAGQQGQDGSWQADPFLTAVVLRALVQDGGIQNGPPTKVVGKVVDAKGGAPLTGATVTLTPTGGAPLTAITATDGVFSFGDDLAAGDYSLSVSKASYAAASIPSLTVVAGQTKDAGIFALAQNATGGGIVRGTVTDGIGGNPLAGVAVELKVSGYGGPVILMNATTDASGGYEFSGLQLPPPNSSLTYMASMTVSLAGYQSVTSQTTFFVPGSVTLFSPALYPVNTTKPTTINTFGKVVDTTGAPLAGVTVILSGSLYAKTALDGSFSLGGGPSTFSSITYTLAGYQTYTQNFTPPAGANVDLGTIVLSNLATSTSTSVFGKVKNQMNNAPITGATVQLNSLVATTDSTGAYAFNNLSGNSFDLAVTAPSYIDQHWSLNVTGPSNVARDFLLVPISANSLNLGNVGVSPSQAGLNADMTVTVTVTNPQTIPVKGVAVLQLMNQQGAAIDTGSAYDAAGAKPLGFFTLNAGQSLPILFKWNSAQFAPGNYTASVRIVAPQTMSKDLPLGVGLAMANGGFTIVPGNELLGAVTASPSVIRSGFDTPVSLAATVQNNGNVPLPNQSYRLSLIDSADGNVAATRTAKALTLPSRAIAKLDFGAWLPTSKGTYRFSIVGDDGSTGAVTGSLNVGAPAQATFGLVKSVVPAGTQTVAANIRLNDVRSLSGYVEDPLKPLLKQAVQRAVRYNDNLSATWTHNNQCFGCHVQAQTLVGGDFANKFAPSYDKAQREAVYRGIVDYRRPDGLLVSDGYKLASAAMGAWSLTESGHMGSQESVDTVFGALRNLKRGQISNGAWSDEDPFSFIGWMDMKSSTPMAVRAVALFKKFLQQHPNTYTQIVPSLWLDLPGGLANQKLRTDPNGNVLVATYTGTIERVAPDGSHTTLIPAGWGVEVGPDGSIYYFDFAQHLTKRSPSGALTTIPISIYGYAFAVGTDGNIYYGSPASNIIYRVTPSGQISNYVANDPLYSASSPHMAFGPSGELVVTTGRTSKLLRIWPDKRSEIVADFTDIANVIDIQWQQNAWWVTTNIGVYKYDRDWKGGFVPNLDYRFPLAGGIGGQIGMLSGFTVIGEGHYAMSNNTSALYRADALPAETQLGQFDAMESKAVDWLLSNPQASGGNNFQAALSMLGLAAALDDITDPTRKARMQAEIQNIGAILKASQLPNGGWNWLPWMAADPMTTGAVGYALDFLNPDINEPYIRKALDFLLSSQQPDGSWVSPSVASQTPGRGNLTAQAPTSWVNIWLPRLLERVGSVDTSLTLELPANIALKNPAIAPDITQAGNGSVSYTWKFTGDPDNLPIDLGFDLELQNMQPGETRPAVAAGNLTLTNGLSGITSSIPIAVPDVSVPSGVGVAAATDQSAYPAQSDVVVSATVSNQNMAAQEAVVKFDIVDALGVTVASLPAANVSLPANGSANVSAVFNTGVILAGGYHVRVSAVSISGAPLASGMGAFAILAGAAKSSVNINSDKTAYLANDTVNLHTRVGNAMSNDILSDLSIVTTLSAPDGAVSFSKTELLAQLLPGALKDYHYAVNLASAPLGLYKAGARVLAGDGTTLASSQSFVQVQAAPSLNVQGVLSATPGTAMVNQPVTLSANITATAAVSGLPLALAVVDPATSLVIQQWTENVANLAAGATYQLAPQTWKAAGKGGDSLLAVLSADVGGKYVNLARQTLSLTPSLAQRVSGSLALSSAAPMLGAALTLTGNIANNGDLDLSNLDVGVTIIDPAHPETPLFSQAASGLSLAQGAGSQAGATWVVAGVAGVKLSAVLRVALNGDIVELARQDFVPAAALADNVSGSLALSSLTPLPGETLTMTGALNNIGALNLAGIATQFSIVDPAAPDAPLFTQNVGVDLAAGAGNTTSANWVVAGALGARLSAIYTASLGGQTVTIGTQDFQLVQKLADRVKGSVTLGSATPLLGDNLGISAGIVNQSAVALPGLAIRLIVVDPQTPDAVLYSKNATLDLGGGQTQIVNGDWVVNAPAYAQLEVRVLAGAENVLLASQPFSVKPKAVVSATQELGGRILVYFSCRPDWDDHDRYRYWERKAPCFGERRQFIDNLLNSLGISHAIVDDEEEFAEAFRNHRYNAYWLLGAFTHFTGKLVNELKESVYRGDALILDSGLQAWRNWDLLETSGARYRGRLYFMRQDIATLGKLFTAVNLATEGRPLMLEAGNGVIEAVYQANLVSTIDDDDDDKLGERDEHDKKTSRTKPTVFPAIVSNVYGKGRVLLFNFDLLDTLMNTQDSNWAVLAKDAFAYLKPQDASISMLGGSIPLDIRLSSKEGDATVKAQLTLPPGASLVDSKPASIAVEGKPTWTVTVRKSESQVIQTSLSGPVQPGEAHVVTQVSDTGGGANIATLDTGYTVLDANQAAAQAVAALGALNVSKNEKSYRDKAINNINDAQSDVKRGRFEQAIRELTEAADFAARIQGADPAAARQAIDRWLRDVEIASLETDKHNKPPVVFPPRNECKVRAGISGKDNDRSLDIDFEPRADDLGKTGDMFVAAVLELDSVPRWFFLNKNGWTLWQGGVLPQHGSGILGAKTLRVLDKLDTSGFVGASIYVGYRVGSGEAKLYPAFTVR